MTIETLQMSWSDVLNVFDGVYLSWDPARWSHTLTFHGWVPSTSPMSSRHDPSLAECGNGADSKKNVRAPISLTSIVLTSLVASTRHLYLNFENENETWEEVWILLTRHVVDSRRISEFISLKVEIEDELTSNSKIVDRTTISAKVRNFIS
jgi:calpain-7